MARCRAWGVLAWLIAGCGSSGGASSETPIDLPSRHDVADGGGSHVDTPRGFALPRVTDVSIIHDQHRAIPSVMFGGWGPHLGHLLTRRAGGVDETWFVDDACPAALCNVGQNLRVDLLRRDPAAHAFRKVDDIPLPLGVQQNTGAILAGDRISVFGVDVVRSRLVECSKDLSTGAKGCVDLPGALGAGANYVGAALSPRGHRMTWFTNVVDGGGGSFSFFVDYGTGWNGPRQGPVGGFNDAAYINVAFGAGGDLDRFTMHGQLVSGKAPAWTFTGATGGGSLAGTSPVVWSTSLRGAPNNAVISTNDVAISAQTGDEHLVARLSNGAAAYYFRGNSPDPKGGAFTGPLAVFEGSFRARLTFLESGDLALVRGEKGKGLTVHLVPKESQIAGAPIDWSKAAIVRPNLPAGYEDILAIYPVASVYQTAPVAALELAIVGATHENEVAYVRVER